MVGFEPTTVRLRKKKADGAKIAAEARAQEINSDIVFGRFDESLARYSQAHASKIAVAKKGNRHKYYVDTM